MWKTNGWILQRRSEAIAYMETLSEQLQRVKVDVHNADVDCAEIFKVRIPQVTEGFQWHRPKPACPAPSPFRSAPAALQVKVEKRTNAENARFHASQVIWARVQARNTL